MRKLTDVIAEQNRPDDRDLSSRSDAKRERQAHERRLTDLARTLVELSARRLDEVGLPEALLDAVRDAQRIRSATAFNRQIRIVRRELRIADSVGIEGRLARLDRPRASAAAPLQPDLAERWVESLVAEGDDAVERFVSEHAQVDRRQMRQLTRNLQRAKPGADSRARQKLVALLRAALGDER